MIGELVDDSLMKPQGSFIFRGPFMDSSHAIKSLPCPWASWVSFHILTVGRKSLVLPALHVFRLGRVKEGQIGLRFRGFRRRRPGLAGKNKKGYSHAHGGNSLLLGHQGANHFFTSSKSASTTSSSLPAPPPGGASPPACCPCCDALEYMVSASLWEAWVNSSARRLIS